MRKLIILKSFFSDTENKKDEAKKTRHATNYPRRMKYRRRQKPQQNNNN